MKIVSLEGENFKRLKAVRIEPSGAVQVISGRNAQGKSSVLDLIWALLGGKEASPDFPIRMGAESASGAIDLGDLLVERTWTKKDSYLKVTAKGNAKPESSPQAILDRLVGKISFDPLGFVRLRSSEQAETLRKMVGLDFGDIDQKRRAAFDDRTVVNRTIKQQEGQLAGIPIVNAPDEETSIADLLEQQTAAIEEGRRNAAARQKLQELEKAARGAKETVERLKSELARAEAQLLDLRTSYEQASAKIANLQDPDIESINAQLADVEAVNRRVRSKRDRADLQTRLDGSRRHAATLTEQISSLDAERVSRLEEASAKLPVPGLSLDGDTVTLNGVPLVQASTAEQIRTGLAISAALNPKLRVALIRDGSLIDEQGLVAIQLWAEANDTQIFLERVSTGSPVGVVIEDGEVAVERVPATA